MTVNISRSVEVTISVSAFDLGREFAKMFSDEQAQFFNGVATQAKDFPKPSCFQWASMRDCMDGLPEALRVFKEMAEYAGDEQ